ncbi:MAG: hypothetical protein ABF969_14495, partial [Sporolactobacillus sp.]
WGAQPTATSPATSMPKWGTQPTATSPATSMPKWNAQPTATSPASGSNSTAASPAQSYPFFSNGTVQLDQAWHANQQTSPASWEPQKQVGAPDVSGPMGKNSMSNASGGKNTVGGYPLPYMPATKRPCGGCGPRPYSPFYQGPSYYGGNQPPVNPYSFNADQSLDN